jgi:hypothetical protein
MASLTNDQGSPSLKTGGNSDNSEKCARDLGLIAHAGPIDNVRGASSYDAVLDVAQAWALAQFLKRVTFATCERHAVDEDEAYEMMSALNVVRRVVNNAGFDPR